MIPIIQHSKLISQKLQMNGFAFLRQANLNKDMICFSCFDGKRFCDSPDTVAIFSVKSKRKELI